MASGGLGLGVRVRVRVRNRVRVRVRANRNEPWLSTDANCPLSMLSSAGGCSFGAWWLLLLLLPLPLPPPPPLPLPLPLPLLLSLPWAMIQASLWPRAPLLVLVLALLVLALLALAPVLLGKPAKGTASGSPAADGCCVREGAPCGLPCSSKAGLSPGLCMSRSSWLRLG